MTARPITVNTDRRAFFTPRSLAAYLAISERTVRQMLADGRIPSYLIGSARRRHLPSEKATQAAQATHPSAHGAGDVSDVSDKSGPSGTSATSRGIKLDFSKAKAPRHPVDDAKTRRTNRERPRVPSVGRP
jgi:excisionase family DNA binding protein